MAMSWMTSTHQPNRREPGPRLELLRVYWRVVGPSKKLV